jgi:hypothetical protein
MAHNDGMTRAKEIQTLKEMEIRALAEENERLKSELEEYTSAVFAGLRENKLSDVSIKRDYAAICVAIEAWMDNIMAGAKDGDFGKHYKNMLRTGKGRSVIKSICQDVLDPSRLGDNGHSDYFFVSLVIVNSLYDQIFLDPYPVGITDYQKRVVYEVAKGMESLHKGRLRLQSGANNTQFVPIDNAISRSIEHQQLEIRYALCAGSSAVIRARPSESYKRHAQEC